MRVEEAKALALGSRKAYTTIADRSLREELGCIYRWIRYYASTGYNEVELELSYNSLRRTILANLLGNGFEASFINNRVLSIKW